MSNSEVIALEPKRSPEAPSAELRLRLEQHNRTIVQLARRNIYPHTNILEVFQEITKKAAEALEVDRVGILLLNRNELSFNTLDIYDRKSGTHSNKDKQLHRPHPFHLQRLKEKISIVVNDLSQHPGLKEQLQEYRSTQGVCAFIDTAIRVDHKPIGVLCFEHRKTSRAWMKEDELFAKAIAELVGRAVEAYQLRQREDSSKEKLLQFIENCPVSVAMFDRKMNYLMASRQWLRDHKSEDQKLIGKNYYELTPQVPSAWKAGVKHCLLGSTESCEHDLQLKADGTFNWIRWKMQPWFDKNKEVAGVIAYREKISEQQEKLEKQAQLAATVVHSPHPFVEVDPEGEVQYLNVAANQLFPSISALGFKHPFLSAIPNLLGNLEKATGAQQLSEIKLGNTTYRQTLLYEKDLKRIRIYAHDISPTKHAEEMLRQQKELFAKVMDLVPGLVFARDEDQRFTFANLATAETIGLPVENIYGKTINSLCSSGHKIEFLWQNEASIFTSGQTELSEERVPNIYGDPNWYYVIKALIPGTKKPPNTLKDQVLTIAIDISEIKKDEEKRLDLEAKQQNTERIDSLGSLAGGIAHDFNNLLMGILGNAGILATKIPADAPFREQILQIQTASKRAAELSKQLLAYSGQGKFMVEAVDLSQLIREVSPLLDSIVSKHARLSCQLSKESCLIEADCAQIRQAVVNLVSNASDALLGEAGKVTLRTAVVFADETFLSQSLFDNNLVEGRYAVIEIEDSGCGMDENTLKEVFDPFFTTKSTGHGLGLSAVLGIVRSHGGGIHLRSVPGQGTMIRLFFPSSAKEQLTEETSTEATVEAP